MSRIKGMTPEEATKILEYPVRKWSMEWDERDDGLSYTEAIDLALTALHGPTRETGNEFGKYKKFKEYFDDLYGKGLEVENWHMNGETIPFDDFYESACEYAEL